MFTEYLLLVRHYSWSWEYSNKVKIKRPTLMELSSLNSVLQYWCLFKYSHFLNVNSKDGQCSLSMFIFSCM